MRLGAGGGAIDAPIAELRVPSTAQSRQAMGMRTRLRHLWEVVTTSYWFVPALMSLAAVGLALLLLRFDRSGTGSHEQFGWMYAGGADGAKTLLSTVAASVVTVAGVAFSITIAAMSQASTQFGPRLLRSFMRDTGNQVVLGTFVATFLYCLLVLRTTHGETERGRQFVPHASVTVSVLMAAASMAVLIYFIHHVSVSLQAPAVVAASAADLERVIVGLRKDRQSTAVAAPSRGSDGVLPPNFDADARPVASTHDGYVQAIDYDELLKIAASSDLIVRLEYRAGDHVIEGSTLARVWPPERYETQVGEILNATFICGRRSTSEQDVEYAVRQMVEIAVRALSPGVNDPFTAINCIDALGSALCRVARQGLPGPYHYDSSGRLRVVARVTTFEGITDAALNQIRQYGRQSVAVMIRLLEVTAKCAEQVTVPEQRQSLLRHAQMVWADAEESIRGERDRMAVHGRWEEAVRALGPAAAEPGVYHREGARGSVADEAAVAHTPR